MYAHVNLYLGATYLWDAHIFCLPGVLSATFHVRRLSSGRDAPNFPLKILHIPIQFELCSRATIILLNYLEQSNSINLFEAI